MANHVVVVWNPGPSDVSVTAGTASAGKLTSLTLSDTTIDAYTLTDAGCIVASATAKTPCPVCGFQHTVGQVLAGEWVTGNERSPAVDVTGAQSRGYLT